MKKQQDVWSKEHKKPQAIPSLTDEKPSEHIVEFLKYLKTKGFPFKGKVIDIGCGKGRNTIYLAKKGFEVYALDYIDYALSVVRKKARKARVTNKIILLNHDLSKKWPFKNDFFDLAIDCYSSIDIETQKGREICRDEMFRTLKPKGIALVACVSTNDEFEKELLKKSPGREKHTVFWPNGKFEKLYDRDELESFFAPPFQILRLRTVHKKGVLFGKEDNREVYHLILHKSPGTR